MPAQNHWCPDCEDLNLFASVPRTHAIKCPDDAYNRELRSVFNISWAIHRVFPNGSRAPICTDESGPQYIPFPPSVEAIVGFLASQIQRLGVDGVYLECVPPHNIILHCRQKRDSSG